MNHPMQLERFPDDTVQQTVFGVTDDKTRNTEVEYTKFISGHEWDKQTIMNILKLSSVWKGEASISIPDTLGDTVEPMGYTFQGLSIPIIKSESQENNEEFLKVLFFDKSDTPSEHSPSCKVIKCQGWFPNTTSEEEKEGEYIACLSLKGRETVYKCRTSHRNDNSISFVNDDIIKTVLKKEISYGMISKDTGEIDGTSSIFYFRPDLNNRLFVTEKRNYEML
ncbi:uncharacterized protein I206_103667 [Kwoniella pini CBS 10737]|uniref:Uncharacterized protein n=1 Tax=Kwoniella pini CBS 10737 TaxID=1296096 RepID=A0A1B9I8Z1_9TREE|nr:uncharacterized protein I206_01332 [Kwoniella pini CBS 10737]OCF52048.1 hypothetical protein I206_01332 [Kwoniella pini CBS 10737]